MAAKSNASTRSQHRPYRLIFLYFLDSSPRYPGLICQLNNCNARIYAQSFKLCHTARLTDLGNLTQFWILSSDTRYIEEWSTFTNEFFNPILFPVKNDNVLVTACFYGF